MKIKEHKWKSASVYIWTTAKRHSEANYFFKCIFPELSKWCEQWRLLLQLKLEIYSDFETIKNIEEDDFFFILGEQEIEEDKYFCYSSSISYKKLAIKIKEDFKKSFSFHFEDRIKRLWKLFSENIWEKERHCHDLLIAKNRYINQKHHHKLYRKIENYVNNKSNKVLLLQAKEGFGKTTFLTTLQRQNFISKEQKILFHFIGASPHTCTLNAFLQRLCFEISSFLDMPFSPVRTTREFIDVFKSLLAKSNKKLLIVIDALERLEIEEEIALISPFGWLIDSLPKNVKIIVSIRGKDHTFLKSKNVVCINMAKPAAKDLEEAIVCHVQKTYNYTLDTKSTKQLLNKTDIANALYLKLLFKLEIFGDQEQVVQRIFKLPRTLPAMWNLYVKKLKEDFQDSQLLHLFFTLLLYSREGLTNCDLEDILAFVDEEGHHQEILAYVDDFVYCSNEKWCFAFEGFKEAIAKNFSEEQEGHMFLAEFFEKQPLYLKDNALNVRKLELQPWHQIQAKSYSDLIATLCNMDFLETLAKAEKLSHINHFYMALLQRLPKNALLEITPKVRVDAKLIETLLHLFTKISSDSIDIDTAQLKTTENLLFQILYNFCYWYDCLEMPQYYKFAENIKTNESKLYLLAQHWHQQRANKNIWLESLRPPIERCNSPLLSVLEPKQGPINKIALSSDKRVLASCHDNGVVKLWDIEQRKEIFEIKYGEAIIDLVWEEDCRHLALVSNDYKVHIWDLNTAKRVKKYKNDTPIDKVAYLKEKLVYIASEDCITQFPAQEQDGFHLESEEYISAFCYQHPFAYVGCDDGSFYRIDTEYRTTAFVYNNDESRIKDFAIFYPNKIAFCCENGVIYVWDMKEEELLFTLDDDIEAPLLSLALNSKRDILAAGDENGVIYIWDPKKKELLNTFKWHQEDITSLCFTAEDTLVSASYDGNMCIWQPSLPLLHLEGHKEDVQILSFSPKGDLLASYSKDTLYIWNIPQGTCHIFIDVQRWDLQTLCFSPDGSKIIGNYTYGTVVWDSHTGKFFQSFSWQPKELVEKIQMNYSGCEIYNVQTADKISYCFREKNAKNAKVYEVPTNFGYKIKEVVLKEINSYLPKNLRHLLAFPPNTIAAAVKNHIYLFALHGQTLEI